MYTYIHIFIYISGYVYRQIDTYYIYIQTYIHAHTKYSPCSNFFLLVKRGSEFFFAEHSVIPSSRRRLLLLPTLEDGERRTDLLGNFFG